MISEVSELPRRVYNTTTRARLMSDFREAWKRDFKYFKIDSEGMSTASIRNVGRKITIEFAIEQLADCVAAKSGRKMTSTMMAYIRKIYPYNSGATIAGIHVFKDKAHGTYEVYGEIDKSAMQQYVDEAINKLMKAY